jgi:hypothetical protein
LYRGARWERLDEGPHPIAIDNGSVYFAAQDGDWSWNPSRGDLRRITSANEELLDVQNGYRLSRTWNSREGYSDILTATGPDGDTDTYKGFYGHLAPDGHHALVRTVGAVRVFAPDSKQSVPLDVPRGWPNGDFLLTFADPETVVVVGGGARRPDPTVNFEGNGIIEGPLYVTWDLSTCSLRTRGCTTFENATRFTLPLLAE